MPANHEAAVPTHYGRYCIVTQVGTGSFATIYRGRDDELHRDVAIKVLRTGLLTSPKVLKSFLGEARILASLTHPGIVPIYDIGRTDGGCYLVTRYVEGRDLKTILKAGKPTLAEAVEIVGRLAEALDHAHGHGLVHRDVKPANVLVDVSGTPMLVDFGLALRREEFGTGPTDVGTPLYMSPEQLRKEGHRVDARSDVYSLGMIFYELLIGRHPFHGTTLDGLRQFILEEKAAPPCQVDPSIPAELDRIWRKATALRAADRFASAQEFAGNLRDWQRAPQMGGADAASPAVNSDERLSEAGPSVAAAAPAFTSQRPSRRIVPPGLRSFGAEDADYFPYLLPGPRSRGGLPESIEFWKARLEDVSAGAIRVGVLYGPSGGGKSSFLRAGLLPRLAPHVIPVEVEPVPDQTESRLRQRLIQRFAELDPHASLPELFAALRTGKGLADGQKVVLVFDQIEQRLNASTNPVVLTEALRQCDGARVQALLLVRDDFWLGVSRLMHNVEVPLVEGTNTALVDLFDVPHARLVLAEFGRAFGRLPDELTPEQNGFLDQAVAGLAEEGKIVPLRLSLLAEMVKEKPWTAATFRALGGLEGIGVAFLEQTLGRSAPASRRHLRQAAMDVLQCLLPEQGGVLKRRQRPRRELLEFSGHRRDPRQLDALLHLLDQDLRLVTPVLEDGAPGGDGVAYQLSHDYLVPALRAWLRREKRQDSRGRAELRLENAATFWSARPSKQMLPQFSEWLTIVLWSRRRFWTQPQRQMMKAASRLHVRRVAVVGVLLALLAIAALSERARIADLRSSAHADELVATIQTFRTSETAEFQRETLRYGKWTRPRLERMIKDIRTSAGDRLHARLVLLPMDSEQQWPLALALLSLEDEEFMEIRRALRPYQAELIPFFWERFDAPQSPAPARFRAACALAAYDPANPRWKAIGDEVIHVCLKENDLHLGGWLAALEPVAAHLVQPLAKVLRGSSGARDRDVAAGLLSQLAADQPGLLGALALDVPPHLFLRLWPGLESSPDQAAATFTQMLERPPGSAAAPHQQARLAVCLLRLGKDQAAWGLLKSSANPEARSVLIHDLAPCGVDPMLLVRHFDGERDVSVRRAVLLALGEYTAEQLPGERRQAFARTLLHLYREDPDPGMHAALGWLLRRWGDDKTLRDFDRACAGKPERLTASGLGWCINRQGMTLVHLPASIDWVPGSPSTEAGRQPSETRRNFPIQHPFAIGATEVTVGQIQRFSHQLAGAEALDHPATSVSWYEAAQYCRWLSEQEGVPEDQMCYPPVPEIKPGLKLPDGYRARTGYRLPTEAEWEYACRAGATTAYFFGQSPALLGRYAWYVQNSDGLTHAVALLKPNDWGLHDVSGNAWEWCDDRETAPVAGAARGSRHVLRGGSVGVHALRIRSAERLATPSLYNYPNAGLRVAHLPVRDRR